LISFPTEQFDISVAKLTPMDAAPLTPEVKTLFRVWKEVGGPSNPLETSLDSSRLTALELKGWLMEIALFLGDKEEVDAPLLKSWAIALDRSNLSDLELMGLLRLAVIPIWYYRALLKQPEEKVSTASPSASAT
jgi:hypothetical protein